MRSRARRILHAVCHIANQNQRRCWIGEFDQRLPSRQSTRNRASNRGEERGSRYDWRRRGNPEKQTLGRTSIQTSPSESGLEAIMNEPIKRAATLRMQVVNVLMDELRNGQFEPGERVTELGLAQRLEVSRTPIREALNQLTEQGLLEVRPRGGYVIPSPTVEQVRQVTMVRMLLEPPAVKMAAVEYNLKSVKLISKAIEAEAVAVKKTNPADFARANEEFRRAVFSGISNKVLWSLISQFANHLSFIRAVTLRDIPLRQKIIAHQEEIRDAIGSRHESQAEELWRSYLRFAEESLIAAMEGTSAPARRPRAR